MPSWLRWCSALVAAAVLLGSGAAAAQEYTARIGHLESPQQPRHQGLEKIAELVSERTDGAVTFEIFPAAQLGNQRQMTESVQFGGLEATVSPAAFLGGFNPAVSILDIPYLYPADREQAAELRNGPFGDAVLESFEPYGLKAIALFPNGRKSFTSSKPLPDVAAFEGQRFRVMDSKILIEQFNALGASAIALPFPELYTALQTGVVDGQENPLDTITTMNFYEVQDYLVVSEHGALDDVVLFNPAWWEALPEEHRQVIVESFEEVRPEVAKLKEQAQAEALELLQASDIEVRKASDEEQAALREEMYPAARDAYLEIAGEVGERLIDIYEEEYARVTGG